jgi:hypothetical protein
MPARQRRGGAQPFAPGRSREAGLEGDADPAGEPFEAGLRGDGGGGQQVRMRDPILERLMPRESFMRHCAAYFRFR